MSQNPTSRSSKQGVCGHGQREVEEVLTNTVPCQPEQLTASFSALKYLQDRLLSLDMQAFYPFVQDVKGFLDEFSASGSALINQAHAYNTHTLMQTPSCTSFVSTSSRLLPVEVSYKYKTNDRILYNLRKALEVEKKITAVNISVGQWSDGLLPIKMMDEPTLAAFSHTHTSLFFYTLTQTYRTVGDENKSVMGHSPPGGFNPEKHNPFG